MPIPLLVYGTWRLLECPCEEAWWISFIMCRLDHDSEHLQGLQ
jgi:hypothetical protein